mmetsp:Transcript_20652/g.57626  ORF Transcript_20652/g.57626 Transcript_20652/m.57626 type:complete len:401 (-) Transcript_20652:448-1650(-)
MPERASSAASPARTSWTGWPPTSMDRMLPDTWPGTTSTLDPMRRAPASTLPATTSAPALFLNTSLTGRRRGLPVRRSRGWKSSMACAKVGPLHQDPSAPSVPGCATRFWPEGPTAGSHCTLAGRKPHVLCKKGASVERTCSKRSCGLSTRSSLLTTTATCSTPKLRASCACSRVWPPPLLSVTSKPASKPPCDPSTSSKAASAAAAPPIMLGTKSRCPGASNRVTANLGVSKRVVATSTVTPRARSSGRSSNTQAQENDAFPATAASRWFLCTSFCETWPSSYSSRPMSVDLPASTCPSTTRCSPGLRAWLPLVLASGCSEAAAEAHSLARSGSMLYSAIRLRAHTRCTASSAAASAVLVLFTCQLSEGPVPLTACTPMPDKLAMTASTCCCCCCCCCLV